MSITKKFTISILAALVFATGIGSMGSAQASGLSRGEAALLAGTGGFILGAIIGSEHHRYRRHDRVIYIRDTHVERCLARYRTYDPRTDTYIGYDGYEHLCRL